MPIISKMLTPMQVGPPTLPNRFIMDPLIRCRADLHTNIPNDLMKEYYTQRASAGLITTEFSTIRNNDAGEKAALWTIRKRLVGKRLSILSTRPPVVVASL